MWCTGWKNADFQLADELIERIFARAKSSDRILTEEELLAEVEGNLPHSLRQ